MMVGCVEEAKKESVQEDKTKNESTITLAENFTVADLNLDMIWLKPGTFKMGSPVRANEIQHQVTITKGFYLGKYEVTQAQWEGVMGNNPSHFKGAYLPVEKVSWNDAVDFCNKLTEIEKKADRLPKGMIYQLPTESQWEYACRAGTTTAYSWGNDINSTLANYNQNIGQTVNVGQYAANAWGFFDMHGNVWEWTADWYNEYPRSSVTNPINLVPDELSLRVFRGGSWGDTGNYLCSALRYGSGPSSSQYNMGFRISLQQEK